MQEPRKHDILRLSMIVFTKPEAFNPSFRVAGCFLSFEGRFLLLQRAVHDESFASHWGAPGGGIDEGESPAEAVLREVREETGLHFEIADLEELGAGYVTIDGKEKQFEYHMYRIHIETEPELSLDENEHQSHAWVTAEEALELPLVADMDECVREVWLR